MTAWTGLRKLLPWLLALTVWELAVRIAAPAQGALPAPSAILGTWWTDRSLYPPHVFATALPAALGFLLGCACAALAAALFVTLPALERLLIGCSVSLFAMPPIALAPVLVITLPGLWPQVALSAVLVYFPTMTAILLGLRDIDARSADVLRSYGAGRLTILRLLRLPACIPSALGGLQVAAPAAILGAILAEFGSGVRWGLGSFLLGSLGRADPARLWGIGLTATAVSALGYLTFQALARVLTQGRVSPTLPFADPAASPVRSRAAAVLLPAAAVLLPLLLWQAVVVGSGLSRIVALTPLDVLHYLGDQAGAAEARLSLASALADSLPQAALGLLLGLGCAFVMGMLGFLQPRIAQGLLPPALLLQSMPLVALTPLIVLLLGRSLVATLAVTLSVSFFPAYVILSQGLAQLPPSARDLLAVYGASRWQLFRLAALPGSLPHLCAAARLVAPRALLGVMTAEWLATGRGLGGLLNEARGDLDYGMIWSVASIATCLSTAFYLLVLAIERRVLGRTGRHRA